MSGTSERKSALPRNPWQQALTRHKAFIGGRLRVTNVIDHLEPLLSPEECEEVKTSKTDHEKADKLVHFIAKKKESSFLEFVRVLNENEYEDIGTQLTESYKSYKSLVEKKAKEDMENEAKERMEKLAISKEMQKPGTKAARQSTAASLDALRQLAKGTHDRSSGDGGEVSSRQGTSPMNPPAINPTHQNTEPGGTKATPDGNIGDRAPAQPPSSSQEPNEAHQNPPSSQQPKRPLQFVLIASGSPNAETSATKLAKLLLTKRICVHWIPLEMQEYLPDEANNMIKDADRVIVCFRNGWQTDKTFEKQVKLAVTEKVKGYRLAMQGAYLAGPLAELTQRYTSYDNLESLDPTSLEPLLKAIQEDTAAGDPQPIAPPLEELVFNTCRS